MTVTEVKTKAEFDAALKNAGNKLVVVDFSATWCGPCKYIGPIFKAMASEFPNVVFLKVDVDENEETSQAYGISAMPTFVFIKNGQKVEDFSGASEDKLRKTVNKLK
ncbi:thioredoxin-like [Glandiceps talaboti]